MLQCVYFTYLQFPIFFQNFLLDLLKNADKEGEVSDEQLIVYADTMVNIYIVFYTRITNTQILQYLSYVSLILEALHIPSYTYMCFVKSCTIWVR